MSRPACVAGNAFGNLYWSQPALYNRDRPVFKHYVPVLRRLNKAGVSHTNFSFKLLLLPPVAPNDATQQRTELSQLRLVPPQAGSRPPMPASSRSACLVRR